MAKTTDKNFQKLPFGAIRPEGWLRDQLQLVGNLQKRLSALPGLLKNGEWIGGEAYPRYVRGLVLLAGALDDATLKDKIETYVLPIFNSANEGGDFGPKHFRSLTPKIEAVKALLSYYELTEDERVIPFLKKYFKNQYNTYAVSPCWYDSRARLLEMIPAMEAVYKSTDLEWLQDLGEKLRDSSNDWFRLAHKFPYRKPFSAYISQVSVKRVKKVVGDYEKFPTDDEKNRLKPLTPERIEAEWKKNAHRIMVETDGVNLAKAVKYPSTYGRFVGDGDLKNLSLKLIANLERYHGTATGMFCSDFRLAGPNPARGIDVAASAEMMESLVEVLAETGEYACADLLEQIAYNVIPAACLSDVTAVQDVLYTNQVEASDVRRQPLSDSEYSNAYLSRKLSRGALSVLSALPFYMQAICMTKDNEINFMTYAPCTMDMTVSGARLVLKEQTGYPFRNAVVFKVEHAEGEPEVKLSFRVPRGTTMQLISGGQVVASGSKSISVKCVLKTGSTFMLKMDIPLLACENRDGSFSLMKGSVLMATKLPFDSSASPDDKNVYRYNFIKKWNVAPVVAKKYVNGQKRLYESEKTSVNGFSGMPFSFDKPPFELKVRCKNVLNWDYDVNGFTEIPSFAQFSEESLERSFVPFGCTVLRIAQFPKCLK